MTPRHATTAPKVRFSATVSQEPEVEVALAQRSCPDRGSARDVNHANFALKGF